MILKLRKTLNNSVAFILCLLLLACSQTESLDESTSDGEKTKTDSLESVEVILVNGRIYSFSWDEPALDGTPASNAPFTQNRWQPDAQAIGISEGEIKVIGSNAEVMQYHGDNTQIIDLKGGFAIPGLVDSHVHVGELGEILHRVDLSQVDNAKQAVDKVKLFARDVVSGEWVIGQGWDEGAWADNYPNRQMLDEYFPDNPVVLKSLHGFAVWVNTEALTRAGITSFTQAPTGGEIVLDENGEPSGILLNRATTLIYDKLPSTSSNEFRQFIEAGLLKMAQDGFVAVHQAGATSEHIRAFQSLRQDNKLATRVYAMLSAREEALSKKWELSGPYIDPAGWLDIRSVKAYYDGALGSRGARLLHDYSDRHGHKGVSGDGYGFDGERVKRLMQAGFQVGIHAIGDAGNRETLDYFQRVFTLAPKTQKNRHRIEHAQVLHPKDISRFRQLGIIASMEPPHAVEDKTWAEQRLGADRIKSAYAWRSLRKANTKITFNSDLPGSDHNIFYGIHSAITRKDKQEVPENGWYPEQALRVEETIRAYTSWAAFSAFREKDTGILSVGRWADITVMDIDPLNVGESAPEEMLDGKILMTIVSGKVVYDVNSNTDR